MRVLGYTRIYLLIKFMYSNNSPNVYITNYKRNKKCKFTGDPIDTNMHQVALFPQCNF